MESWSKGLCVEKYLIREIFEVMLLHFNLARWGFGDKRIDDVVKIALQSVFFVRLMIFISLVLIKVI